MELLLPAQSRFDGEFESNLDSKNRVTVPAAWLLKDADFEELVLVLAPKDEFLEVMTPAEFARVSEMILTNAALPDDLRRPAKRAFQMRALRVNADKQGRLVLPEKICQRAGLSDRVTFVGMKETFEIWNPDRLKPVADAASAALDQVYSRMVR